MAFRTLEERFNENVNKLYANAKTKFDGGKASTGRNDDPLIVRRPGDGYWNFAESRSTPVVSALNDVKRVTLFTLSRRGILFLAKQQLLQTGNTFEQTRLINPLFTVGNAVPFLHLRRNARPLTGPYGITKSRPSTKYEDLRKIGQLQKSTYDAFDASGAGGFLKKLLSPITNTVSAFTAKKNVGEDFGYDAKGWAQTRPELGRSDAKYINSKKLTKPSNAPLGGILGSFNLGFLNSTGKFDNGGQVTTKTFSGQLYGPINKSSNWNGNYTTYLRFSHDQKSWDHGLYKRRKVAPGNPIVISTTPNPQGEPQLSSIAGPRTILKNYNEDKFENNKTFKQTMDEAAKKYFDDQIKKQTDKTFLAGGTATGPNNQLPTVVTTADTTRKFIKYFTPGQGSVISSPKYAGNGSTSNARDQARNANVPQISYITDPSNFEAKRNIQERQDVQEAYKKINVDFKDPINVSFAMGKDSHVKFRAYIKDLQQSVKPEYKPYQYIGRIEKFISYTTVQRSISFKLGVVAFSKDELEGVWRRINYLTGLAYPYGFNRGIMQPNIVRLSIGNVYTNQPGYIDSLNTNFSDLSETWDIDREVPIAAQMDINFIIIEKSSKIADSPLYGITETLDGFDTQIPTSGADLTAQQNAQTPVTTTIPADRNPPAVKPPTTNVRTNTNVTPAPINPNNIRLPAPPRSLFSQTGTSRG